MVGQEAVPAMEERRSSLCGDLTARDARNLRRFNGAALGWMVVWMAVRFWMESEGAALGAPLSWVLVAIATLPGLPVLTAYVRFLRQGDELLRKVQLEALALGFGAGAVFMMGWRLVEKAGGPDLDVSDPLLVMVLVWALAQWWGARRYR